MKIRRHFAQRQSGRARARPTWHARRLAAYGSVPILTVQSPYETESWLEHPSITMRVRDAVFIDAGVCGTRGRRAGTVPAMRGTAGDSASCPSPSARSHGKRSLRFMLHSSSRRGRAWSEASVLRLCATLLAAVQMALRHAAVSTASKWCRSQFLPSDDAWIGPLWYY